MLKLPSFESRQPVISVSLVAASIPRHRNMFMRAVPSRELGGLGTDLIQSNCQNKVQTAVQVCLIIRYFLKIIGFGNLHKLLEIQR